jgi:hypothetical protein
MQRRAAAAYLAFFLVIAAGAYGFIATAEAPAVTISGDNVQEIQEGDTVTAGDRVYTVASVTAEMEGGGEGSAGEIAYEIAFEWTNASARYTTTWTSNATADWNNQTYRVITENGTDDVEVRWEPTAAYSPSWTNGTQFVDGDRDQPGRQDVPLNQFIRNSTNESIGYANISEGDTIDYRGNETTVETVTNTSVRLAWTAPRTNEITSVNNQNVTLNGEPYVVTFQNNDTVLLGQGTAAQAQLQEAERQNNRFNERINGFWAVAITSALTLIILGAVAFLPRKE